MRRYTTRRKIERGSATVELAILLPIYLLLIFGLIYLAFAALDTQKLTQAAGYAALQPGMQSAEELQAFFPWHGRVESAWSNNDGTYARTGETVQRLVDVADSSDFYSLEHVTETLGGIAVATWGGGGFTWTPTGVVATPPHRIGNDRADYLVNNGIALDSAPLQSSVYEQWVTMLLDGYAAGGGWLERRSALAEFIYNPPYFGRVFSQDALTAAQYFSGQGATAATAPTFTSSHHVALRGSGERFSAHQTTSAGVLGDAGGLMSSAPLPGMMAVAERDALGRIYWPAAPNIWLSH